jgi:ABC-2 type transport system ATP-binding protein
VLLGLLRPDSGEVRLLGGDPWRDSATLHRRLAYVPGDVALWPKLSGGEVIDLLGRIHGGLDELRRDELIERFELDPRKKSRTYSTGNRRKVALIAALATNAELLVLDEPTAGLDPLMEAAFRDTLREARDAGQTVLLSSHILSEVEAACDRVSIIRRGRTEQSGSLEELRGLRRLSITATTRREPGDLAAVEGVHNADIDGTTLRCSVDRERLPEVMDRLGSLGVMDIVAQPPTLEDLFLEHYREDVAAPGTHRTTAGGVR